MRHSQETQDGERKDMKTKTQEEDPLLLHIFLSRHPNLHLLYLHDPKVFLSDFWMTQRSLKSMTSSKISQRKSSYIERYDRVLV